jgi:signal transduction histidine kinase
MRKDLVQIVQEHQTLTRQETLRQEQHLLNLHAISSRISGIADLDRLLDEFVQLASAAFESTNTLIYLTDESEEEFHLVASSHPVTPEMEKRRFRIESEGITSRLTGTRIPFLICEDNQGDLCMTSAPGILSTMVAPMSVGGRVVGLLSVESDRQHAFDEQDARLLTILGNHAAAAIEAIRTVHESQANAMALEQRANNLVLINRISTALSSSLDAYEILNMTVQHLVGLLDIDYGNVLALEQDGRHAQVIAEHPVQPLADTRLLLPPLPSARPVLELGIPYPIETGMEHPLSMALQRAAPAVTFRSLLLVSLLARRELIGILLLASFDRPRSFSEEEMEICQTVASQAAVAVANARLLQDVQQQRHALTRRSEELTEATGKLDAILKNIADGLVVTDQVGRIILSNPAFGEMADVSSPRSLNGHLLAEVFPVAGLFPLVSRALEMPGRISTENLELPDGRVLKTSSTALRIPPPILEPQKEERIAGVVTVLRDITHEVEVDRMKTDFISAVSHELRSPLTSILGFTNLIQRDLRHRVYPYTAFSDEAHQIVDRILANLSIIEEQGQRLTRLINDVLDLAKIESGRIEWPMEDTNLTEVVHSAVTAASGLAKDKHLPIHVNLPPSDLPFVRGHRDRLIQVITNLLSNSIRFTEQGQITVSGEQLCVPGGEGLPLNALPPGDWVILRITDTGIGIPAEEIPHLFEKFTQAGDTLTEKPAGTGLGLAISKEIIEHHGGRIWVESEPGHGSTFSFILPAAPLQTTDATALASEPQAENQHAEEE